MSELVKSIKCRRCDGSGMVGGPVVFAGIPGACFKCAGSGEVEGDRATLAAAKVRGEMRRALGKAAFDHSTEAHLGLNRLEEVDPARLVKALESFAAGRTDVLDALVNYWKASQ